MRIYEIRPGYHVDLASIVGIQKFSDEDPDSTRRNPRYHYWLEIVFSHGEFYEVSCQDAADLNEKYKNLLNAWKVFVNDNDVVGNTSTGRVRIQKVYQSIEGID